MRYILPLFALIFLCLPPFFAQDGTTHSSPQQLTRTHLYEDGSMLSTPFAGKGLMENNNAPLGIRSQTVADSIVFDIGSSDFIPGETVCIPVRVEGFDSVVSIQFTMKWNPLFFEFVEIQNLVLDNASFNTTNTDEGYFTMLWVDTDVQNGTTLPDGSIIFDVCFKAIGSPGDMSDFSMDDDPVIIEVTTVDNLNGLPVNVRPGKLNIISPDELSAEFTSCSTPTGTSGGSFSLTMYGGRPPYDIQWELSNDATINGMGTVDDYGESITFTGLPPSAGLPFYDVTVTDADGNVVTLEVEIANTPSVFVELGIQRTPCPGFNNGIIYIDTFQSTPPNQIEWNTGHFNTTQINDLGPGVYSITLTDAYGCEASDTLSLVIDSIEIDAAIQNATCTGVADGSITVTASGGTPDPDGNYTFIWENQPPETGTSSTLSGISTGGYTVTVTDESQCLYVQSFTVEADQEIIVENLMVDSVSCYGGQDGRIELTVGMQGGPDNPPYGFLWSESGMSSNTGKTAINDLLMGGTYDVTVFDVDMNNNPRCTFDTTITVHEPDSIVTTVLSMQNESCDQGGDGFISVTAQGGTPMSTSPYYGFEWSNGESGITITDLVAGDYTVTVTDANGCTDDLTVTINQPTAPVITSFDSVSISCNEANDGSLTVNYELGNAPIEDISWSPSGSGEMIDGLSSGQYIVTITAEDGCTAIDTAYLSAPLPLRFDSLSITEPTCPDEPTGQIIAFVSGGTGPHTYDWSVSGSADNPVLPSLAAGTYSLTVIDANNCAPIDTTITLTDPPIITAGYSNIEETSCFNTCDGSATVQGSGGSAMTGNYTYTWSTGETGSTANALCPGENYVTVSDGICAIIDTIIIDSPDSVIVNLAETNPVSCYGMTDGSLEITASGGTGPYDYSWDNMQSSPEITGLRAGTYTVEVTDVNGCQTTASYTVQQPDSLVLQIDTVNTFQISCGGYEDGIISLLYTGGNIAGNYNFNWSPDVSDGTSATELGPGLYRITVSDEKGCSDTTSIRLAEPPPIQFTMPIPEEPDCFGEETQINVSRASGGTGGPYTYTVNNTGSTPVGTPIDLLAGSYLVSIFDGGGCAVDTQITIDQPNPVEVDIGNDVELALGDSILLQGIADSDVPLDSFRWNPSQYLNCDTCLATYARPFDDQEYILTVTDINGCKGSDDIWVRVNSTRQVYIPNAFTPNNDGINDFFEIFAGNGVRSIETVQLFNRWGDLIYEGRNFTPNPSGTETWDGSFKGKKLEPGVYVYIIEISFLDGQTLTYRGDITLIR